MKICSSPIVLTSAIIALRSELAYLSRERKGRSVSSFAFHHQLLPQPAATLRHSRHIHARHHKVDLILLEVSDLDARTGGFRSRHDRKGGRGRKERRRRRVSRRRRGPDKLDLRDLRELMEARATADELEVVVR